MGLSQDEIEKMMSESGGSEEKTVDEARKNLLERIATLFTRAIENIVPVLVGMEQAQISTETFGQGKSGELISSIQAENTIYFFSLPALCRQAIVGWIGNPLALGISQKMMGQEGAEELDEALLSALNEAFNNILGAFDTSLKEEFGIGVEHADLKFVEGDPAEIIQSKAGIAPDADAWSIPVAAVLGELSGPMGLLMTEVSLGEMFEKHPMAGEAEPAAEEAQSEEPAAPEEAAEQEAVESAVTPGKEAGVEIAKARFEELQPRAPAGESRGLDLILDVPLDIAVELGRKTLSVKEILGLVPGSLVELDKLAGEAVDLLVNGKLFAKGEVVVIDENFGVRVSSIVTPKERIERMTGRAT